VRVNFSVGVTHLPEVQCIHLGPIFARLREQHTARQQELVERSHEPHFEATTEVVGEASGADKSAADKAVTTELMSGSTLCLVLATDGVWDNWLYEDVNRFVLDASCLCAVAGAPDGARRVTMSFMQRNSTYSKRNFGGQADNATGIVMYLSDSPAFPAL
jgi:serine/threonine protein phosphatase PrpC